MSTRAHIRIVEGKDTIQLYHHHDGYPEGIGKDMKSFLEDTMKGSWYAEDIANKLVKGAIKYEHTGLYDGKKYIKSDDEYEITTCIHGDEEYVYVIDCQEKSIKCYRHGWDEGTACIKPENEVEIPELNKEEE